MHKHKNKDMCMHRMAYLTQFLIPALLNPMINKMVDEASAILLLICSHEVWFKVAYDWVMAWCLFLCLCRPCFHQSKLWHKHKHRHKHKHKKNKLIPFSCANCTNHHLPILVLHPLLDLPLQQVLLFSFLPVGHSVKSLLLSKSYKLSKADTL